MTLFDLVAKLTMDSSDFDRGVRNAESAGSSLSEKMESTFNKIGKVAKTVIGGAVVKKVVGALKQLVDETAQAGDKIDKQSQVLGMSRKAYQEWEYILGQNGASIESMSTSMKTLNSLILSGVEGSKESADAFAKLGLHLDELDDLSQEQQFETVVKAFQNMPSGAKKSALAVQIFGKQGMQLLPLLNQSSTSIDDLRKRAEELGLIMSDEAVDASVAYGDSLDDLQRTFNSFKYAIGSKILPVLTTGIQKVTNFAGKLRKAYDEKGLSGVWDTLVQSFKNIKWPTWKDVSNALERAWNGIREGAKSVLKLVFGENADGGIAFPTADELWVKIKKHLTDMWEGVKGLAHTVLKLIFGEDADGNIQFPTPEEIEKKVREGLTNMWEGVKTLASNVMKLIFGESEDGGIEFSSAEAIWGKIGDVFKGIWGAIQGYAKGVLKFIFGETEDGGIAWPTATETWNKIKEIVSSWWAGIRGFAKSMINLTLQTLGLPDIDKIVEKIKKWWADIKAKVKLTLQVKLFGFDPSKGETWGGNVMNDPRFPKADLSQYDEDFFNDENHAKGLWTVPYDGYRASLHRNERVLTASQARHMDDGGSNVDVGSMASVIADAVKSAIENATIRSYINGRDITDEVNRTNMRALKAGRFAT